jgi:hypothetical protein
MCVTDTRKPLLLGSPRHRRSVARGDFSQMTRPIPSRSSPALPRQKRNDMTAPTVPEPTTRSSRINATPRHIHVAFRHENIRKTRCMPDSATAATALLLALASALLIAVMLYPSALLRWFQRKRYQYEVTFSLYMLTSTEKFIFSTPSSCPILATPYAGLQPSDQSVDTHEVYLMWNRTRDTANNMFRFGPLPPPQSPHHRRVPLPPRTPQHHHQPHLLLLQRQRERALARAKGSWRASTRPRRGVGGEWEGVYGAVRPVAQCIEGFDCQYEWRRRWQPEDGRLHDMNSCCCL